MCLATSVFVHVRHLSYSALAIRSQWVNHSWHIRIVCSELFPAVGKVKWMEMKVYERFYFIERDGLTTYMILPMI